MYCDTRETNCYLINQHEKSKKVIQPKHNIRTQSHPKERKTELVYWEGVCVCVGGDDKVQNLPHSNCRSCFTGLDK